MWHQKMVPEWLKEIWFWQSERGGGWELFDLIFISLIFCKRSKFVYYVAVFSLGTTIMDFTKYFYAHPRPYLHDGNIKPVKCQLSFGNPSSHSMASSIAPIVMILDIFHGSPISLDSVKENQIFYSNMTYFFSLLLALYWQISMPYIRFIGGVHSLN